MGIPTVTLARNDFVGVVRNAVSGIGLMPDVAMVSFPIEVFLPGADLAPIRARRAEFLQALTAWTPRVVAHGAGRMLGVEGADYEDALAKANDLLLAANCGDGLPLWPPTERRVQWMLRGAAYPAEQVLGTFPPRGGIVTVRACAIALAMAGGRPEYLPVLIAAVEAVLDPAMSGDLLQATSGNPYPVVVVNGPVGAQIGLNSGFGCLGPDPQHPAGASIGRALRLMQQNLGGALPGNGTMAVWGPMRYTNAVFGEDEEGLPGGWLPFGTERHGLARGTNSASLIFSNGATNIFRRGAQKETAEEDAVQGLHRIAGYLRVPNIHYLYGYEHGTPGMLVVSRVVAGALAELGWSKARVRDFLWEQSRIPMRDMKAAGGLAWMEIASTARARESSRLDPWPICAKPEDIDVVVAGGGHSSHALWLQGYSPGVTAREIRLPPEFDVLLDEARRARVTVRSA